MSNTPGLLVHKSYWDGHSVEIRDNGNHRSLYFDSGYLQSRMSLSHPQDLVLSYTRHMMAALLVVPEPRDILIVGIGAGSLIQFCFHHFPKCRIDAVDSFPHIIDMARGYFSLPENNRILVHCCDGLQFLQKQKGKNYDLILVDAFDHQGMAPSIYSEPFFSHCAARLENAGVMSCNLWGSNTHNFQEITKIIADYFTGMLYLPVPDRGNIIVLAMKVPVPWSQINLKNKAFSRLSSRFGMNVKELADVAKVNNLSLSERLLSFLPNCRG